MQIPETAAPRWPLLVAGAVAAVGTVAVACVATPAWDAARVLAAFVWCCVLPGVALHRALRGRPDTLVADLTLGSTLGVIAQLAGWAIAVGAGVPWLQAVWPLLVLAGSLALPRARARVLDRTRYPATVGVPSAVVACLAGLLGLFSAVGGAWSAAQLPPGDTAWYQDMYWYLGSAAELGRTIVPQTVQAIGDPFLYHWFSMAFMASLHAVSGVALPTVVGRLWLVPFVWLVVGGMLTLSLRLTGRAAAGAVASVFCMLSAELREGSWYKLTGFETMVFLSPSQVFGIPILALALDPLVELVRSGRMAAGAWAVLILAVLACPGSKSSILPVLACALALVVALAVVRRRPFRGPLVGLAVVMGGLVAGLPLTQGGSAGTNLQLFAMLGWQTPWRTDLGAPSIYTFHDRLLSGVTTPHGLVLLVLELCAYAVHALWLLPGLRPLARLDPGAWLLAGLGVAGFAAMLLINHDGLSEAYFLRGIMPFAYLLGAWGVVELVDAAGAAGRVSVRRVLALGGAGGVLVVAAAQVVSGHPVQGHVIPAMALSLGVVLVAVVAASVVAWLTRGRAGGTVMAAAVASGLVAASCWTPLLELAGLRAGTLWPVPVAAGVAAVVALWPGSRLGVIAAGAVSALTAVGLVVATGAAVRTADARTVTTANGASADEYAAARWVADHTGAFDVVATNVHCLPKQRSTKCDARAFWVSGFTERRILVEGWGYTVEAHAAHGVGGQSSRVQPFHDQALFALNEAAFYDPTAFVLQQLRARGVRWLYADNEVAPISPALATLARPVFTAGPATVYALSG